MLSKNHAIGNNIRMYSELKIMKPYLKKNKLFYVTILLVLTIQWIVHNILNTLIVFPILFPLTGPQSPPVLQIPSSDYREEDVPRSNASPPYNSYRTLEGSVPPHLSLIHWFMRYIRKYEWSIHVITDSVITCIQWTLL